MNIVLKNSENLNIKRNDSEFQILKVGKHIRGGSVTKQLLPWEHYVFEEVSSLTITLGTVTNKEINIFSFEFDSGSTPTVLTLPSGMGYIGGAPTIEANAHYYFEIEKSYDGRYFCKYEKYNGGGSYILQGYTILSWDGSSITMSDNISVQDVVDHLLMITSYGNVTALDDPTYTIKLVMGSMQVGTASVAGNIISYQNAGPTISDIQWV